MKHSDYWEGRKAQRMWEHMQRAEDTADDISKLYLHASRYLNHEINGIFDRYAAKHKLSKLEAKQLLNSLEDPTDFQAMLNRLKAGVSSDEKEELIKMLEAPAYRSRINRLEKLQSDIDVMMKSIYQQEKDFNTVNYINVAHDAYYKSIYDIQSFTGYGFSFNQLNPVTVDRLLHSKWSGMNYSDRIWNNTQAVAKEVKEQLLMAMITGKTEKEIADEIANKYSTASIYARRLIRTESCYIAEELEAQSYEECGAKKYIYLATLDLKTSEDCRELDGKTFLLKKRKVGVNCPPMHPWCRSTTIIGITDDVLKGLHRRARDPETGENYLVSGNTSYKKWFADQEKKYGADTMKTFQDKVQNLNADKRQLKKYTDVLGEDNVPKSIEAFQEMKYNDNKEYGLLKDLYKGTKSGRILQDRFDYTDSTGKKLFIPQGTAFNNAGVMAGSGTDKELRVAPFLAEKYGGNKEEWQKKFAKIVSDKYIFDMHWYELNSKQYEMKIKLRKDNDAK